MVAVVSQHVERLLVLSPSAVDPSTRPPSRTPLAPMVTALCMVRIGSQANGHPAQQGSCITWMELYPIVLSLVANWERLHIRFHSDNQAVQAAVRSVTCRCTDVLSLLHSLFYLTSIYSCLIDVEYIPGVENALADAVSRGRLQVLRQLHPSADWQPTPPEAIPTLPGEANHLPQCSTTVNMH